MVMNLLLRRIVLLIVLSLTPVFGGAAQVADITRSPLSKAIKDGEAGAVQELIAQGANPNERDLDGLTPIMVAAATERAELIEELARHGAQINAVDNNGDTPLKIAAAVGCYNCVQVLLSYGADVNARGEDGQTALVAAIYKEHSDIVRVLLLHGADPNARVQATKRYFNQQREYSAIDPVANERGTPLMAARMSQNAEIIRLLVDAGAVLNPQDMQTFLKRIAKAIGLIAVVLTVPWSAIGVVLLWKLLRRRIDDSAEKQKHDVYVCLFFAPMVALTWAIMYFSYEQETAMMLFVWPPALIMNIASIVLSLVSAVYALKLRTADVVFNLLVIVTPAYWILDTYLVLFGGEREVIVLAFVYAAITYTAAGWLVLKRLYARKAQS